MPSFFDTMFFFTDENTYELERAGASIAEPTNTFTTTEQLKRKITTPKTRDIVLNTMLDDEKIYTLEQASVSIARRKTSQNRVSTGTSEPFLIHSQKKDNAPAWKSFFTVGRSREANEDYDAQCWWE